MEHKGQKKKDGEVVETEHCRYNDVVKPLMYSLFFLDVPPRAVASQGGPQLFFGGPGGGLRSVRSLASPTHAWKPHGQFLGGSVPLWLRHENFF